jgi:hypothetical protein
MNLSVLALTLILLTLFLISPPPAEAQAYSAILTGTVTDASGAYVPGAVVAVSGGGHGVERKVSTDENGDFVLSFLEPGDYRVLVSKPGFASVDVRSVRLSSNDRVRLPLQLKVGNVSETVVIEASDSPIDTGSAAVSTVISKSLAESVPLNGRSFQSLVTLSPGVVSTKSDATNQGQFSVNGQRADSNYFMVDGVSGNIGAASSYTLGGTTPATNAVGSSASLVSIDALEELNIQTASFAPQFGRSSGGQISVTTRSGSNQFRGSVYEYFRNDALDANDWFANSSGLGKPPLRHNDFGGVLGGPILPKKVFFFFSYEGLRLRQPNTLITSVPSMSLRASVPAEIRPLLNAFPVPNGAEITPTRSEFRAIFSNPRIMDATSLRIDFKASGKLTIFGRYNYAPSHLETRGGSGGQLTKRESLAQTLTAGASYVLNSRMLNTFRLNFSKSNSTSFTRLTDFGGAVPPPESLLYQQPFASPSDSSFSFSVDGSSIVVGQGGNWQHQVNLVDDFSVRRRDHQLQLGVDFRRMSPLISTPRYSQSISTTGALVQSSIASQVTVGSRLAEIYPVFKNLSAYVQDVWSVNRRLTLTYGLRWELNPPPKEKNGNYPLAFEGGFNPDDLKLVPGGYPFWETRYTNFAPRLGAAYLLFPKPGRETVVRGGFGVFYDLASGAVGEAVSGTVLQFTGSKVLRRVALPLTLDQATPPEFNRDPPYREVFIFDPELKTPRTYQWSAGIEQSLGPKQSVSVAYVGAAGRKLITDQFIWDIFNLEADFLGLHFVNDTGTSDYNSLQVKYDRRPLRGLDAIVSYTWSRSFDTSSNDSSYLNGVDPEYLRSERGPSDFDVRHSLSAGLTYQIPAPRFNKLLSAVIGGWTLSSIITVRSATPITFIQGYTTTCETEFICTADCDVFANTLCPRPDVVPGVPIYLHGPEYPGGMRLNPAAFASAPPGRQGTLGRNALRGFPAFQTDLSLRRTLKLGERIRLELTAEAFNVFNHPNFADPDGMFFGDPWFDDAFFGKAFQMLGSTRSSVGSGGEAGLNPIYQLGTPRSIQLAVRLRF